MREMKDSGIEWIGEIPKEWETQKAKWIFKERNEKGNSIVLQLLSPSQKYGVIPQSELDSVVKVKEDTDLSTFKTIHAGDYCISLRSFQGGFEYSTYEGVVSPAYHVFYANGKICDSYYKFLFKCVVFIEKIASLPLTLRDGKNISFDMFGDMLIPIPPLSDQQKISTYLDTKCTKIDSIIEKQEKVIDKLKEYKLSVITEAVTKGLNPDVKMKDSGVEWIGEVPEECIVTRAGHIFNIILGKMLSPTPKQDDDTFEKYLCAANVHFTGISYEPLKQMWFSKIEKNLYAVHLGDLLVVEGGAGAGGAAIVEEQLDNCYIQNSIMIVRSKENVSNKWLYYTLYAMVKRNYVDYVCNKATIPHFTKDKLGNVPVVIFTKENETEIVNYLDKKCSAIDKSIEQKQAIIEKLKEYKKSLIYEVVTGKREV